MDDTDTAAAGPSLRLRAAGFLATAAGAVVAGLASMLPWLEAGLRGVPVGVVSPTYLGVDLAEGTVTLVLSVVALFFVLLARAGRTNARRWTAVALIVAGLGIVVAAAELAMTAGARFERDAIDQLRATSGGRIAGDLLRDIARLIEIRLRPGVWLALAGGFGVALGGALTLAWARGASTPPESLER